MRTVSMAVAFVLGACSTAAVQSAASAPETTGSAAPVATPPAVVTALADATTRTAPSGKARVAFLARGDNAFIGRLEMDGGGAVPEHRDATEEYIHVLEGGGTITIDGTEHALTVGSTVYMPANALVSFANGADKMVAIQVFAGPGPAAKYDNWIGTDQ
jgi:quercetin dioxygenase-like cupin family protein